MSFSSSHMWMWDLDYKESWAQKNWCFWTVVLEKTLESPWTTRRSNQSILKEISPGCSLEGLKLKLRLQYFGHMMWRADSFEKTLMLGKIEGRRRGDDRGWDGWMASPTQWKWVWVSSGSQWWTGRPGVLWFMGWQRVGHEWVTERNWLNWMICLSLCSNVFPSGSAVKKQPTTQETHVWSLGWEDLLETEMATYSNILDWDIPRMEKPGELQYMESQKHWTWLGN